MKFLKRNIKLFVGIIIGVLIAGGIVYAATINAREVDYTTSKNGEVSTVEQALNDLYNMMNSNTFEFGQPTFETYKGDRQNISVTKKVNSGKYLVAVSRTIGATDTQSFSEERDEDINSELICDKNCSIKRISNKRILNTASTQNNNAYGYYDNLLGLYEVSVEEGDTTVTYNYKISSASTYALGCILEVIELK